MLEFYNPGILNLDALRTFGVNVKEREGAIGHFGTGLKYAIAVCLRQHYPIRLYLGADEYSFAVEDREIRGETFGMAFMFHPDGTKEQLGFTTHLGAEWEDWMAFRELYCNALDEGGSVRKIDLPEPEGGMTKIGVKGLEDVWRGFYNYFLPENPTLEDSSRNMDVLPGPASAIFYRGIRALELKEPAKFTYNIKEKMRLSEDRQLANVFSVNDAVARHITMSQNEDFIRRAICTPEGQYEGGLQYMFPHLASTEFINAVHPYRMDYSGRVNISAIECYRKASGRKLFEDAEADMTPEQRQRIQNACAFLARHGHTVIEEIKVINNLGSNIHGGFLDGKIYLPQEIFRYSNQYLARAILEEHLHGQGYRDESRNLQNWLFDALVAEYLNQDGGI